MNNIYIYQGLYQRPHSAVYETAMQPLKAAKRRDGVAFEKR
jgi:hypothetical protein